MILATIKYGFTLKDILENDKYGTGTTLSTLFTSMGINYTIPETSLIQELFNRVYNKYADEVIFIVGKAYKDDTQYIQSKMRDWLCKFLNTYEETKVYYETYIGLFEAKKSKLLDQVEATNINEVFFNDTPQNDGGVFSGVDYTTHYTKTTSTNKSDMNSLMKRLDEVKEGLFNYWKDWLKDLERIFIEIQHEEECSYE